MCVKCSSSGPCPMVMWCVPPSFQFWGCASALRAGGALVMANPTSCWEVCGCRDGWTDRQLHKASPVPWGGGRGTRHHPTHLPAACSWVGFLSADDQVLVMVAITLPRISMYAYLPPCLHCFNSCVCFSLSPPSLDYRRERKHAAHRALQSSGGGERGGEGIVPRSTPCGDRAWLPPHHSSGVRVAPRVVGLGGGTGLEPLLLPVDGAQMP